MDSPSEKRSREASLLEEGWTRQFAADEPRLSEAVELYRKAGFEVRLEPFPSEPEGKRCPDEEGRGECRVCFEGFEAGYKVIYTRPQKTAAVPEKEWF